MIDARSADVAQVSMIALSSTERVEEQPQAADLRVKTVKAAVPVITDRDQDAIEYGEIGQGSPIGPISNQRMKSAFQPLASSIPLARCRVDFITHVVCRQGDASSQVAATEDQGAKWCTGGRRRSVGVFRG